MNPCPRLISTRAPAVVAAFLMIAGLVRNAPAGSFNWIKSTGGSTTDSTAWSPHPWPGANDVATFGPNAGYNVSWVLPIDTASALTVSAGRPRFYASDAIRVAGQSLFDGDSLTLASGIFRTGHFLVGSGATSKLLITAPGALGTGAQLIASDSILGSYLADQGVARVGVFSGARLTSNSFLEMAFSHTDNCSTLVLGGSVVTGYAGISTMSALGGGLRGDIIVGDTGTAVLQVGNGAFAIVQGDLSIGKHGGSSKVHMLLTGTHSPTLTVHGQTYVGANGEGPGHAYGTGILLVERGTTTLMGMTHVQRGSVTIRNGSQFTSGGDSIVAAALGAPPAVNLIGPGTVGTLSDTVVVGSGAFSGTLSVDSAAACNITGSGPFNVGTLGSVNLLNGTSLTAASDLNLKGTVELQGGMLQAPTIHVTGQYGLIDGYGTVAARVSIGDSAQLYCEPLGTLPATVTMGNSSAPDGFSSTGNIHVGMDTLVILHQGVAELGQVNIGDDPTKQAVLDVGTGGHFASGKGMYMQGSAFVYGPILNDGTITEPDGNTIAFFGDFTQLGGSTVVTASNSMWSGGGITYYYGTTISARGRIEPDLEILGSVNLGPTPAHLQLGNVRHYDGQVTGFYPTTVIRVRLGSKASGIQDTLVDSGAVYLDGTLDLRSIPGHEPVAGDTLTALTALQVHGTFASVTINGQPSANWLSVLYGPTFVKVVIKKPIADVPPTVSPAGPLKLSFSSAGSLRRPAFALTLPTATAAEVRVYDISGREVARLHSGPLEAGAHLFELPSGAASGVYFARAEVGAGAGARVLTARVVRVR